MEERELSSSCNTAHYYYLTFKCVRSVKCSCCTCMLYVHVDCYQIVTFTIGNLIWTDIQHTAQLCPRLCLSRWNLNIGWILICCGLWRLYQDDCLFSKHQLCCVVKPMSVIDIDSVYIYIFILCILSVFNNPSSSVGWSKYHNTNSSNTDNWAQL